MALTEYSIVYTKTNQSNTSTHGKTVQLPRSGFSVSGNTNVNIGQITRILFKHRNNNGGVKGTWTTTGRLYFGDGTYITSNSIKHTYNGDNYWTTNTFSGGMPTPDKFATWTRMDMLVSGSGGTLQWEATSSHPITITVYFYRAEDLIVDAEDPDASGATIADGTGYSTTYGAAVQGRSNLTITGQYTLDARYPDLSAVHTLTLTDSGGSNLYSATQPNNAVFAVGAVNATGTVTWTYTVTDGAGGSDTATGTFTVLAYSPPSITDLVVQRYTEEVDDGGTVYVASEDGDHVWFSFTATASALNNLNNWSLSVQATQEGQTPGTPTTFESHGPQQSDAQYTVTKTNDRTILTSEVSASTAWTFTVTVTDGIDSASATFEIEEATAFFDVEENGVSVGMRSTGTANDKRFEVADDYTAHFYGGIVGITDYTEGEVATGGTWVDGLPIYRRVILLGAKTSANLNVSISSYDIRSLISFRGVACTGSNYDGYSFPIPNAASSIAYMTTVDITPTGNLTISSTSRNFGSGVAVLEYTKNADYSA